MNKNSKFLPKFEKLHIVWAEIKKSFWVPAQVEDFKPRKKKYAVRLYFTEELKILPESKLTHYLYNPYPKDEKLPKLVEDAKAAADEHLRTSKLILKPDGKLEQINNFSPPQDQNNADCDENIQETNFSSLKKISSEEKENKLINKKRPRSKLKKSLKKENFKNIKISEHQKEENQNKLNFIDSDKGKQSGNFNSQEETQKIIDLNLNKYLVMNIQDSFLNSFENLLVSLDHTYLELKTKIDTLNRTIQYFQSENYSQPSCNDKVFSTLIDKIKIYISKTYCKQSVETLIDLLSTKLKIEINKNGSSDEKKLIILSDTLNSRGSQTNLK
jgi:hypothetical protein